MEQKKEGEGELDGRGGFGDLYTAFFAAGGGGRGRLEISGLLRIQKGHGLRLLIFFQEYKSHCSASSPFSPPSLPLLSLITKETSQKVVRRVP